MKILQVVNNISKISGGGSAERTKKISQYLSPKSEITIITTSLDLNQIEINEIKKYANIWEIKCLIKRFYFCIPNFKRIKEIVLDSDIIHLISFWSFLHIYVHFYAIKYNKKIIISPLGALINLRKSFYLKKIFLFLYGNKILKSASHFIFVTKDELIKSKTNLYDNFKKFTLIPNGIDKDHKIKKIKKRSYEDFINDRYILYIGRLNYIKGPDILLESFIKIRNNFPSLKLIFIGKDEGMKNKLLKIIKNEKIKDKVKILDFINEDQKINIIKNCEFLAVPSRHEAMSIVVLEAGINKKTCIITDQCGFGEISDTKSGIVAKTSILNFSRNLQKILMLKKNEKKIMAKNFYNLIIKKYLWKNISNIHYDIFKKSLI